MTDKKEKSPQAALISNLIGMINKDTIDESKSISLNSIEPIVETPISDDTSDLSPLVKLRSDKRYHIYHLIAEALTTYSKYPVKEGFIRHYSGTNNRDESYKTKFIPKKRGGLREINIPDKKLKYLQLCLLRFFADNFEPHKTAKGFVKKESIITNAVKHTKKRLIFNLDLEDFFSTITDKRIYGMFLSYPFNFSKEASRVLTNLTTYRGSLPQGAPTSPFLSNLICRKLDSRLYQYAFKNHICYTRYADDLTFSTNKSGGLSESHQTLISKIIFEEGFKINQKKVRVAKNNKRQIVNGIVVNKKLNIKREEIRSLRSILFNIKIFGWESQANREMDPIVMNSFLNNINENEIIVQNGVSHYSEDYFKRHNRSLEVKSAKDFLSQKRRQKKYNYIIKFNTLRPEPKAVWISLDDLNTNIDDFRTNQKIKRFKEHIKGRIDFLGQVRKLNGKDDKLYLDLKRKFDWLITMEQLTNDEANIIKDRLNPFITEINHNREQYKLLLQILGSGNDEKISKFIECERVNFLEFYWISLNSETDRKFSLKTAFYSSRLNPKITALFFEYFKDPESFEGLVHGPQVNSEGKILPPKILLAKASGLYQAFHTLMTLPNSVKEVIEQFLASYRSYLEKTPDSHPWEDLRYREDHILNFKRAFRFDDGDLESFDLVHHLSEFTQKVISENPGKIIHLPKDNVRIYTHTASIWTGICNIITSMITNNKTSNQLWVKIEKVQEIGQMRSIIKIYDENSFITKDPELSVIFGNKLKQALTQLRGFVEWRIIAAFSNKCSYTFDVMQNRKTLEHNHTSGVMHILEFH